MNSSSRRCAMPFMGGFVLLALLLFPSLAGAQATFSVSSYGAGDSCWAVDAGNFDNDSDVDVVAVNLGDNDASVLLNNGSGTFATKSDYGTGNSPRSVGVGDFDEDGYLDLVVVNSSDGDVSILLNDQDGTFGTKTDYSTGSSPYAVAVADFDKDGNLDVAVGRSSGNSVEIMMGNGDGTLDSGVTYTVYTVAYSIAVGYFDSDTYPDLVLGSAYSSDVFVLLNDGDGTFGSASDYAVDGASHGVAVGDFDEDGYDDIVAAISSTDVVSVLINDGDGTFGTATDYAVGDDPRVVAIGDFDVDGDLDIAAANYVDSDVSVLLGDGDGTFGTKTDYAVGSYPMGICSADFNGDSKDDLVTANASGDNISVMLNTTSVNTAPAVDAGLDDTVTYPANATLDATVSDDGLPNPPATVTTTWSMTSGPGTVTFGNASAVDTTAAFSVSGTYVLRITADDSDETDYDEVTITVNATPSVNAGLDDTVTYPANATLDATVSDDGLPNPPATVTTTWSMTSGPGTVTFGNASAVDTTAAFSVSGTYVLRLTANDGDVTDYDEVTIAVNATPSVNAGLDDTVTYPSSATLDATVSDDGLPNPPGTYTVLWTKQSGPGTVTFDDDDAVDTTASFSTAGTYVLRLTADDSDATDYDEVTITVNTTPSVNAGLDDSVTYPSSATLDATVSDDGLPNPPGSVTTTWTKQSGPGTVTFGNASAVDTTAGFDTSGTYVLRLTANDGSAEAFDEVEITVDESSGSPSSVTFSVTSYSAGDGTWAIDAGNFDSDSDVDLVAVNLGDNDASVFLNNGNGTFATKTDYGTGSTPRSVAVGDFDEDGYVDFAVANSSDADISILLNDQDGTFGTKTDYSTGSGPYFVAVGDFDKDNNIDLAVARVSGNVAEILTGNGDGSLDTGVTYSVGNVSYSVAAGYFDSDTYLDLVLGDSYGADVSVLINDGDGTFGTYSTYAVDDRSYAVAIGDFDEDGYDDIVAVNHTTDVASVLLNDGDGTFGTNTDYAVGDSPEAVTVADFNWDGHLDIAVANTNDNDVSVLLGIGDGTFGTKTDYAVGSGPRGIVAADFNGDSKTDLATANAGSDNISVLLNTSTGSSNSAPSVDAGLDDIVTYPSNATLDATVTDDGLPDPPASVTTTWTKTSGPGAVTFGNASTVDTTAAFSASGTYVLRLTADDGDETDYDEVTVVVNAAPSVDAGFDDTVTLPSNATLDATVSDDGLPNPPATVTTTWTKTSGPGTVTFGNASAVDTTAAFSASGTYVLRLTAGDGDTTAYDEVTITVNTSGGNTAPTVNAGIDDAVEVSDGASLDATVTDDGLPNPPASVTTTWTKQSGPGTVTFGNSSSVDTTVAFDTVGTYVLRLTADDSSLTDYDEVTVVVVEDGTFILPCRIQAEDYHDESGTATITTDDVDGGDDVYCLWVGDWMSYNVYVPTTGVYTITVRAKSIYGGAICFRVEIDDEDMTGTIGTPLAGSYYDVTATGVQLTAGTHVLKYYQVNGWSWEARVNWIEVAVDENDAPVVNAGVDQGITLPTNTVTLDATVTDDGDPNPPSEYTTRWTVSSGPESGYVNFADIYSVDTTVTFDTGGVYVLRLTADDSDKTSYDEVQITVNEATSRVTLPGRLEAEDYSDQGEGTSYHDTTSGNAGSVYRSDDVDIEACGDSGGGYDVYTIADDEWLAFDVRVPADTCCYDITARVSSTTSSREIHVEVDGVDVTGPMTFDSTGGWTDITVEGVHMNVGNHVVKVVMDTGDFKLNYIDILAETYEEYIVESGVANADIVISSSPLRSAALAADELQDIIYDITGATLPIVSTPTGADVHIYVGQSSYTDSLGISTSGLEYEGYKIVTGSDWMALIGADTDYTPIYPYGGGSGVVDDWDDMNDPYIWELPYAYVTRTYAYDSELDIWNTDGKGTLNAVYAFLYDLGCRWYFPGSAYDVLPALDDIGLPGGNRTVNPDFPYREIAQYYTEFGRSNNADEVRWQLRLGINDGRESVGVGPRGHGIQYVIGREEYNTSHPEYYAIWNGSRQFDYMGGTPCLSSTGLLAENIEFVETLFDHYGEPMVNVSPSDGYGYLCECEYCEGKSTPERDYIGLLSDYVWGYIEDLAEDLYLTHPTKKVNSLAYTTYYLTPEDIETMSPNVVVTFCRWRSWFEQESEKQAYEDAMRDWMEILPNDEFFVWDYYLHPRPPVNDFTGVPVYFPWIIRDDLRFLKDKSLGDYIEVQRNWPDWNLTYHALAANHLNVYLTARLYWDAEQDVDALIEEYYTKFYGDASDEMKVFVEYCEANWLQAATDIVVSDDFTKIDQMRTYLNSAISSASGVYADRVDLLDDFLAAAEAREE